MSIVLRSRKTLAQRAIAYLKRLNTSPANINDANGWMQKPANLLLNSAAPATQSVTCTAQAYTLALIGTGSVALSGTASGTLTGTGANDLVVLTFTPTAGSVTFTKSGSVTSFGLFTGTLSSAQILAMGGIPLTTTAASTAEYTRASLWLPGTTTLAGLLPNNYKDSTGTTPAVTDDVAGLVVDALGVMGPELVGSFSGSAYPTGFYADGGWAISGGVATFTFPGTDGKALYNPTLLTIGKTYKCTMLGASRNGLRITIAGTVIDSDTAIVTASAATSFNITGAFVASGTCTLSGISVRELSGIHLSQATAGYKPFERRGLVNLLTWSHDVSNASYGRNAGATTPNANTILLPSTGAYIGKWVVTNAAVGAKATAFGVFSGSGTVLFGIDRLGTGAYEETVQTITLTSTPTLYAVSLTIANAGQTGFEIFVVRSAGTSASSVTVDGLGIANGAYTASDIIAKGGIPLTTTAAASSTVGPQYLSFDGSDDKLVATIPAGYESVTVIDAKSTGQVTTPAQNIVGTYNITTNTYGRIVIKDAISASNLALVQAFANKLAGL